PRVASASRPATSDISTPSLHDALPISPPKSVPSAPISGAFFATLDTRDDTAQTEVGMSRTAAELPRLASPDSIAELSELMARAQDRKSTRLNSSHVSNSYAVFCLKKKK